VSAAAQPGTANGPGRLEDWLAAIDAHQPGDPGKAAVEVSTWTGPELEGVVAAALRHAHALAATDPAAANRMLLRGAALHADIGRLIPEETTRRSPRQQSVYTIKDGRWQSVVYLSLPWQLGRSLVEGIVPHASASDAVRTWYRETSKDLIRLRSIVEAQQHLTRGLQLFPKDGLLLFYTGVVHERYSSSLIQAGSDSLAEANRGISATGSPRAELTRAARYYRDALVDEPTHVEARLRHGRVLGDLGRHEQAIAELRRAVEDGAADELLYFARLFLGRNYEALGDYAAARGELEAAAAMYPRAQTPRLALSHIARRAGNRAAAQRELQVLAALPEGERQREDPWWTYYDLR
jgi:tetratricopeptide (TPR) repeat protein